MERAILEQIDSFKKDTEGFGQKDKLYYAIGYFSDCKEISSLLCYIAGRNSNNS